MTSVGFQRHHSSSARVAKRKQTNLLYSVCHLVLAKSRLENLGRKTIHPGWFRVLKSILSMVENVSVIPITLFFLEVYNKGGVRL